MSGHSFVVVKDIDGVLREIVEPDDHTNTVLIELLETKIDILEEQKAKLIEYVREAITRGLTDVRANTAADYLWEISK
jgi:hypothetical protein